MEMITVRIDGVDYELPKAAAPHVTKALETRDTKITELTTDRDKQQGRADAAEKSLGDTKKKLDAAEDPKRLDALVTARTALVARASKVLGKDVKLDGKTEREVQELVLKKLDDKLDLKDRSDDCVAARFDAAVDNAVEDRKGATRRALLDTGLDDDDDDDGEHARADGEDDDDDEPRAGKGKRADNRPAWQRPLAINNDR